MHLKKIFKAHQEKIEGMFLWLNFVTVQLLTCAEEFDAE